MFIVRLILVILAALVVRRLVRAAFAPPQRRDRPREGGRPEPRRYGKLTQQDVSDADYEEIP